MTRPRDEGQPLIGEMLGDPVETLFQIDRLLCRSMKFWCDPETGDVNVQKLVKLTFGSSKAN
jgi:hypothetical protein